MQYLGGGPSELFPDGYAVCLCLVQHPAGILPETSGDSVRLPALEEQQVLVWPRLVKGIVHIPLPGHPVKFLWGPGELDAVGRRAVGHQLFHGLPAVGRLVGPAFLLYLPASRPEHIGQPPGRQLSRPYGQRDGAPGNILVNQSKPPPFMVDRPSGLWDILSRSHRPSRPGSGWPRSAADGKRSITSL